MPTPRTGHPEFDNTDPTEDFILPARLAAGDRVQVTIIAYDLRLVRLRHSG
ncbi:hypothetical protein GCM10009789_54420 [Kribbella sancticallisti]|uniref:Uncharacterized protein n=1 Tax=Kribbella sancticallisti TaxID=460087 RepID=A0ABN2E1N4_9ACTN